ncbi:MAG: hypothetical protein D8M59_13230 [Planctomycetes bacterium]|nr:hypothetical protein [Planctomycetota bacterium]
MGLQPPVDKPTGAHHPDPDTDITAGLTDAQRDAVCHMEGPVLIMAAAGSGKTLVITRRIANLLASGVPAWSILALTFTNKAAEEMRRRVESMIPPHLGTSRGLVVGTFHSFCARLLRRYADRLGLSPNYSIYDTSDQTACIKEVIAALDLSSSNFRPAAVLAGISRAKNELVTPEQMLAESHDFWAKHTAQCYRAYQEELARRDAVDFDDLLMYTSQLLSNHEDVRTDLQQRFQYVMVDEYQDTNHAQFLIAHTIAAGHRNICVVGDPDQSIYAWRGADIRNILDFETHYPDACIIKLGENFRSTAPILAAADTLIQHNQHRHPKPLFTSRDGGVLPEVVAGADEHHEAMLVVDALSEAAEEHGLSWKDMAVFYRTNALSRVMEGALRDRGIPYRIVRGTAFYDRKEVKDVLCYLRVLLNPADTVSLKRVINFPTRGIGSTTVKKVEAFAAARGLNFRTALEQAREINGVSARAVKSIGSFLNLFSNWGGDGSFMGSEVVGELAELVSRVIVESGLEGHYKKSEADEDRQRLDNLDELVSSAAEFERDLEEVVATSHNGPENGSSDAHIPGLDDGEFDPFGWVGVIRSEQEESESDDEDTGSEGNGRAPLTLFDKMRAYLEQVALVADADAVDPDAGAVQLMTLHAAKGLEFPMVAIIGLEEGLLPHMQSRDDEMKLEEERRLCFVGITRAQEYLRLTCARLRTMRGIPEYTIASRFLFECGQTIEGMERIDRVGDAGSDDGQRSFHQQHARGSRQGEKRDRDAQAALDSTATTITRGRGAGTQRRATGGTYPVGAVVVHPQFGKGTIESSTGKGATARVRVKFQGGIGTKTLVAEYARLKVIG